MSATQLMPVGSAILILLFALMVFGRWRSRGGTHLFVWGVGLAMFGVGSFAEAYSALGWHPVIFRLWYLTGAVLNAAWLGQGTVYLLSGQRMGNLLASLFLGYLAAVAVVLGAGRAVGAGGGMIAVAITVTGALFAVIFYRAAIRRWDAQRVTNVLTGILVVASAAAAVMVFSLPLNAARFRQDETLSAQYREILPPGAPVRRFTPIFNIYGTLTLVGGALYSAWLLWRKQIVPQRVLGNIFIAGGALALAFASTLVRLGLGDYLYLAELVAAAAMFAGFLLATMRPAPQLASQASTP